MMYLGAAGVRSVDLTWLDGVWGGLLWVGRALCFMGDGVQLSIGRETDRA